MTLHQNLKKITTTDECSGWNKTIDVYDICTTHALSQVSGYLKYANSGKGSVYFCGQDKKYPTLPPSLFRNVTTQRQKDLRISAIKSYIEKCRENLAFIKNTPEYAYEPILQQYGFKTRWVDIVDNIWTALWFATHRAVYSKRTPNFINFEVSLEDYAFIYMIGLGNETINNESPGLFTTEKDVEVIDLRKAVPSVYIRPHSQHGLLFKRRVYPSVQSMNMMEFVVGVLRIEKTCALKWLGSGELSSTNFVFPPPMYDRGYGLLLLKAPHDGRYVGLPSYIYP